MNKEVVNEVITNINEWLFDLNHSNNHYVTSAECPMNWSYVKIIGIVPKEKVPDKEFPKGTTHVILIGIEHWSQETDTRPIIGNMFPAKLNKDTYELTESIDEVLGNGPDHYDGSAEELINWVKEYDSQSEPLVLDSLENSEIMSIVTNPPKTNNVKCCVILGYAKSQGITKMVEKLKGIHREWGDISNYYDYNSEGFELTLVTNTPVNADVVINLLSLVADQDKIPTELGNTNRTPIKLNGKDFDLDNWDIDFYGWLPGSNFEGTDYYSELELSELIEGWVTSKN
jgi:hypothetical protein